MSYAACRFPLAFVGLLASVSPVHGYEALSQDRRAQVEILRTTYGWLLPHLPGFDPPDSTTLEPFSASEVAPGFGPFDADVSVTGFPASFTMQSSDLRPGKITASGSHNGFAETTQIEELPVSVTQVFVEPTTATSFSVTFSLGVPTAYDLLGSVTTQGSALASSLARIQLLGPGGSEVAAVEALSDPGCIDPGCVEVGPIPLVAAGVLAPGTYTLEAEASGTALGIFFAGMPVSPSAGGEFDVALVLTPTIPSLGAPGLAVIAAAIVVSAGLLSRRDWSRRTLARSSSRF